MVPVMKGGDGARWPDCHYGLMNPLRKSNLTFSHTHTHTPDWSIAYVTWDLYTHLIAIVRAKVTVHQYVYTAHQLHAAQHGTQHGRKTSTSSWLSWDDTEEEIRQTHSVVKLPALTWAGLLCTVETPSADGWEAVSAVPCFWFFCCCFTADIVEPRHQQHIQTGLAFLCEDSGQRRADCDPNHSMSRCELVN